MTIRKARIFSENKWSVKFEILDASGNMIGCGKTRRSAERALRAYQLGLMKKNEKGMISK